MDNVVGKVMAQRWWEDFEVIDESCFVGWL